MDSSPIIITPAIQATGRLATPGGAAMPDIAVYSYQLDGSRPATEMEVTTSDSQGFFLFSLPRHETYSSKYVVTVPTAADFPFYGFLTGPEITVDLVSTVLYEWFSSLPVPIAAFKAAEIEQLLAAARKIIDGKLEAQLIQLEGCSLQNLRKAYKNALQADADFYSLYLSLALVNGYSVVGVTPFGTQNSIPSIMTYSPALQAVNVQESNKLSMNISASDAQKDQIYYVWKLDGNIVNAGSMSWDYIPSYDAVPWYKTFENHTIEIIASDGGLKSNRIWTAVVANKARAPIFTTSPITNATEEQTWIYTPAAESPDGAPFTLRLRPAAFPSGMDMCLSDTMKWQVAGTSCSTPGQISWTPNNCQTLSVQQVQIEAADQAFAKSYQAFSILVTEVNTPPEITSTPASLAISEGDAWSYQVTVFDPQADPADQPGIISGNNPGPNHIYSPGGTGCQDMPRFSLLSAPSSATIDLAKGLIKWTPKDNETGYQTFNVQVSDLHGGIVTQKFTVQTQNVEFPSAFKSPDALQTIDVNEDDWFNPLQPYTLSLPVADPDESDIIPWGLKVTATGLPANATVIDPDGTPNGAKIIWPITDNDTTVDTVRTWPVTITVCDKNPKNYPLAIPVPDLGDTIRQVDTHFCTDRMITFRAAKRNISPEFTSSAIAQVMGGQQYVYDVTVIDRNINPADSIAITLDSAPAGMTLTQGPTTVDSVSVNTTAQVKWNPNNTTDVGPQLVTISATDSNSYPGASHKSSQQFYLFVQETNLAPHITSAPVLTGQNGQAYSYQVTATDPNLTSPNKDLIYSLATAPSGMTIDPNTGLIAWTPTTAQAITGSADVVILVTDKGTPAYSDSQSFTIALNYVNLPASFDPVDNQIIPINVPYSLTVIATDDDNDPVTMTVSNLPAGASFDDQGEGTGLFSWTPSATGMYTVTFTATSDPPSHVPQTASMDVTFTVTDEPVFLSHPVVSANVNGNYSYEIHALDPSGTGLAYQLDAGPSTMKLDTDANGITHLTWTPTMSFAGNQSVILRATDGNGKFSTQSFTIKVKTTPNNPPVVTATVPSVPTAGVAAESKRTAFSATASDNDSDTLHYSWYWDGVWKADNGSSYPLTPSPTDAGDHVLKLVVTDGAIETTKTFNVHVRNTVPVLGDSYTFPSGTLKSVALAQKAGTILALLSGGTKQLQIFDESNFKTGPTKTLLGFTFDPVRMTVRNDFAQTSLVQVYFALLGSPENGGNVFMTATTSDSAVTTCVGCSNKLFESPYLQVGGTKIVVDQANNRRFYIKPSNRQILVSYSGGVQNPDMDLGAGAHGADLVLNPSTQKLYISDYAHDSILVFDAATRALFTTISLPGGGGSSSLYLNPVAQRLYVYNANAGNMSEINLSNHVVTGTSGGLPVNGLIDDPLSIMTGDSTDDIVVMVCPAQGKIVFFNPERGSARSLTIPFGTDAVYFNSQTRRVIGAGYSGKQIYSIK